MRPTPWLLLEPYRHPTHGGEYGDPCGAFEVPYRDGYLRIIASSELGWDHVSVSRYDRCPDWDDMARVKDLFWLPEETAIQIHPPESEYVNHHPNVLHLWRPHDVTIPLPPTWMIGLKSQKTAGKS